MAAAFWFLFGAACPKLPQRKLSPFRGSSIISSALFQHCLPFLTFWECWFPSCHLDISCLSASTFPMNLEHPGSPSSLSTGPTAFFRQYIFGYQNIHQRTAANSTVVPPCNIPLMIQNGLRRSSSSDECPIKECIISYRSVS